MENLKNRKKRIRKGEIERERERRKKREKEEERDRNAEDIGRERGRLRERKTLIAEFKKFEREQI